MMLLLFPRSLWILTMPTYVDNAHFLMFEAVKAGREDKVRALISSGCHGDAVDADGRTPLHWACQYGHLPIACLLISSIAALEPSLRKCPRCTTLGRENNEDGSRTYPSPDGSSVHGTENIMSTHRSDDELKVREVGAYVCSCKVGDRHFCGVINRRDSKGQTPLHVACNFKREDLASFLATLPLCDVDVRDNLGHTPLHRAIHGNMETLACLLVDVGADVHAANSFRWTPLHEAARTGNENVISALLSRGCDVNAVTHNGMTPFLTAVFYYRIALRSAYKTLDSVLKLLIEAGCRLSQGDSQWTPLSASIMIDNSFISSLLLYSGCRFERQYRSYGRSLLVEAFARCEPFVVKMLVLCGYQASLEELELCSRRIPSFSPMFLRLPTSSANTSMKEKYELLYWLRQRARTVCSLMELSRTAVRFALNSASDDSSILSRIPQLPLPRTVRDFLTLSDFDENLFM